MADGRDTVDGCGTRSVQLLLVLLTMIKLKAVLCCHQRGACVVVVRGRGAAHGVHVHACTRWAFSYCVQVARASGTRRSKNKPTMNCRYPTAQEQH